MPDCPCPAALTPAAVFHLSPCVRASPSTHCWGRRTSGSQRTDPSSERHQGDTASRVSGQGARPTSCCLWLRAGSKQVASNACALIMHGLRQRLRFVAQPNCHSPHHADLAVLLPSSNAVFQSAPFQPALSWPTLCLGLHFSYPSHHTFPLPLPPHCPPAEFPPLPRGLAPPPTLPGSCVSR